MTTLWRESTRLMDTKRTRVLRRTTPVVTGDGDGSVEGTGEFRLYWDVRWVRNDRAFLLGPFWKTGGYVQRLREQGWRSGSFGILLGLVGIAIQWRWTDEDSVWDPQWRAWQRAPRRHR